MHSIKPLSPCITLIMAASLSACAPSDQPMVASSQDMGSTQNLEMSPTQLDQESSELDQASADDGLEDPPPLEEISVTRANQLATKAYLYAYPAVMIDVTRQSFIDSGVPDNTLVHLTELPDPTFNVVVRPNTDTLYSTAFLNLKDEPVILEVPTIDPGDRFYMISLIDAWSNAYTKEGVAPAPGTRTNLGHATTYFITGPDYTGTTPAGMTPIPSPTNSVWAIGRTEVLGPEDVTNVLAIQQQYKIRTWSDYQAGIPPAVSDVKFEDAKQDTGPLEIVEAMPAQEFYERLIQIMRDSPPPSVDADALAELAELGLRPEYNFDYQALSDNRRVALERSESSAMTLIDSAMGLSGRSAWSPSADIELGDYGTNYALRAVVAKIGLGANLNIDARYINATTDNLGRDLEGSRNYVLHFDKDELPPVNAFWSLTLYNQSGYLTANDALIYSLGSNSNLIMNADQSLDIYIQNQSPGAGKNWLPSPLSAFELTMRLYWPKPEALKGGSWEAPAVKRRL